MKGRIVHAVMVRSLGLRTVNEWLFDLLFWCRAVSECEVDGWLRFKPWLRRKGKGGKAEGSLRRRTHVCLFFDRDLRGRNCEPGIQEHNTGIYYSRVSSW